MILMYKFKNIEIDKGLVKGSLPDSAYCILSKRSCPLKSSKEEGGGGPLEFTGKLRRGERERDCLTSSFVLKKSKYFFCQKYLLPSHSKLTD